MMNFLLQEMTCLRYFVPLIQEGNRRNIASKIYWRPSNKYNCPSIHLNALNKLGEEFNFRTLKTEEFPRDSGDIVFSIEGRGTELAPNAKKVALTSMTDFRCLYDQAINNIDYYIFPNKSWITHIPRDKPKLFNDKKTLYLGSPKYDVFLDKQKIIKKYNLPDKKKCLILFPRYRDIQKINLIKVIRELKNLNFEVCMKARGKEPCPKSISDKVRYFEDESWHPHTSMELISVSDLIINTDSTGIKECVMLRKPVLNFKIKPFANWLDFLCCKKFHSELDLPINYSLIEKHINRLQDVEPKDFQETIDNFLFEPNSSKRILDFFKIT